MYSYNYFILDETKEIQWLESKEIVPDSQIKKVDEIVHAKMFTCGDVEIGHVVAKEAFLNCNENELQNAVHFAETQHSDLIAGKYEGKEIYLFFLNCYILHLFNSI